MKSRTLVHACLFLSLKASVVSARDQERSLDGGATAGDSAASTGLSGPAGAATKLPKLIHFERATLQGNSTVVVANAAVLLELAIDEQGHVVAVSVIESGGEVLDQAAVDAAKQFQFEPAEIDNKVAAVKIKYRYLFNSLAATEAPAATDVEFKGIVRDKTTGKPMPSVRVELDGQQTSTTDTEGQFRFEHVEPGRHSVTLIGSNFVPLGTQETLESGTSHAVIYDVEVRVEQLPEEELSDLEIVVISSRLQKSIAVTSVTSEQGSRVAGTGGDVIKVVENLPGVARSTAGSGQLVVWGSGAADTRVYVDGIRIPSLYHQGGFRSVIHTDLVGSVELVPGGYGASYGRGLGGLITVAKRAPADDRLHGSAQVDLLDASTAIQGPIGDKWRVAGAARRSHLDSVLDHVTSRDVGEFFPIAKYYDAQASARYLLDKQEWIEVGGLLSSDSVAHTLSSSDPAERKRQTQELSFDRLYVRYSKLSGDGSEVLVVPWAGRDRSYRVSSFGGTPTSLELNSMNYGLRASWRGSVTSFCNASVGLDLEATESAARRAGSITSPPREGDAHIFGQPPSDQVNVDSWTSLMGSAAPYAEGDVTVFDQLHLVPGLRLEPFFTSVNRRTPQQGESPAIGAYIADFSLQPRLALRYSPTKHVTYKAAYGRYRQQPLSDDLSPVFGNALLQPASATHWLAGVSVRLGELVTAETTVFYSYSDHLTVRNPVTAPLIAQALVTQGQGRAYGMQVLLRRDIAKGLFGWVAYTLLRSERNDSKSGPWRIFDFDQTHVLTALASYSLGKGYEVGARFRYATGYPRTPVIGSFHDLRRDQYDPILGARNSIRIPDFVQVDLRISKRWKLGTTDLELYADVQNLTNRQNSEEIVYGADYSSKRYIHGLPLLPVLGAKWSY